MRGITLLNSLPLALAVCSGFNTEHNGASPYLNPLHYQSSLGKLNAQMKNDENQISISS